MHDPSATVVGATAADAALRSLGIVRLALPVPFAEAGGTVNLYLIDNPDGSLTLFDTGVGTDEGKQALLEGFAAAGRRLEDVRQILISHGHLDHFGAAELVRTRSGARVLVHPRDAGKIVAGGKGGFLRIEYAVYLGRLGVPEDAIRRMGAAYRDDRFRAERLASAEPLEEGAALEFRGFRAVVLHTPGHTPGHVCLHAPTPRIAFTADHLLAQISPNPLLELGEAGEADKFRALSSYLASARRIEALDLDWVLPGHGEPFTGHRPILAALYGFYEKRQAKLQRALAQGPRTPYELVLDLFGHAEPNEIFLMVSEVVGNLEVLEERHLVERLPDEVPYRYRLTAA